MKLLTGIVAAALLATTGCKYYYVEYKPTTATIDVTTGALPARYDDTCYEPVQWIKPTKIEPAFENSFELDSMEYRKMERDAIQQRFLQHIYGKVYTPQRRDYAPGVKDPWDAAYEKHKQERQKK